METRCILNIHCNSVMYKENSATMPIQKKIDQYIERTNVDRGAGTSIYELHSLF